MSMIDSVGSTTYLNSNGRVGISQPITLEQPPIADYSTRVDISNEAYTLNNEARAGNNTLLNRDIASPSLNSGQILQEQAIEGQRQALGVVRDYEEQATSQSRVQFEQNLEETRQDFQLVENERNEADLDTLSREARLNAEQNLDSTQSEFFSNSEPLSVSSLNANNESANTNFDQTRFQASNTQSNYQSNTDPSLNRAPLEGYSGTNTQSVDIMV